LQARGIKRQYAKTMRGALLLGEFVLERRAKTEYPIHELLARPRVTHTFSDQPVERTHLLALFEAARWAPSSGGEQPWSFLVARGLEDKEAYQRLRSCLGGTDDRWAQAAPVLALSVARMTFADNGAPNPHAVHDVGAATMSLRLQAAALRLLVHPLPAFDREGARALFRIPVGYEPVAALAIGYPAESPQHATETLREALQAPRTPNRIDEFVFTGVWGRRGSALRKPAHTPRWWGSQVLLPHWG
jgi:nitroreductase